MASDLFGPSIYINLAAMDIKKPIDFEVVYDDIG